MDDVNDRQVDVVDQPVLQYMLLVNQSNMELLSRVLPGLIFVPIMGMNIQDNDKHMLLVCPKQI